MALMFGRKRCVDYEWKLAPSNVLTEGAIPYDLGINEGGLWVSFNSWDRLAESHGTFRARVVVGPNNVLMIEGLEQYQMVLKDDYNGS